MNNSNRCPECGGIANHILTSIDGKNYYQCSTGLTTFKITEGGEVIKTGRIVPCDTILNQHGNKFTGTVAYVSDNKVKTLSVTDGKERR